MKTSYSILIHGIIGGAFVGFGLVYGALSTVAQFTSVETLALIVAFVVGVAEIANGAHKASKVP